MHLAAACTNGKLLPNMERMEPFNVIYQTAEDGLGDLVKPRLIEAGADLDRVLVIDDSEVQLTLSDERIEKAIVENNARLVIIDPIQGVSRCRCGHEPGERSPAHLHAAGTGSAANRLRYFC